MTFRFGFARQQFASALFVTCMASAPIAALADSSSPAITASSTAPRQQIDGPFAHAMCSLAFEFGAITGKWEMATAICRIALVIDPD